MKNILKIIYFFPERSRRFYLSPFPSHLSLQSGQALVTLLFFTVIGITVVAGSVMVIFANSLSGMRFQQGSVAYEIAQSGMENGLLRLLRDPGYTGETLSVGSGSASIAVVPSGVDGYTVTSVGTLGNFTRRIESTVTYSDNEFEVTSRKEIQ